MLSTKYISNCTERNLDDLKTAILFFDKIELVNNYLVQVRPEKGKGPLKPGDIGVVTGITNFITDNYKSHIDSLIQEGVVSISDEGTGTRTNLGKNIDYSMNEVFHKNISFIFEESNSEYDKSGKKISSGFHFSDEAKMVHEEFVGSFEVGNRVDLNFLVKYYSSLFGSLINHMITGEQCMTSSNALNSFFKKYSETPEFKKNYKSINANGVSPNLALNAISIAVPNISSFPFDEVLETRVRANDELLKFRNEMETFQFNLLENYSIQEIHVKAPEIIKHKLEPTLSDLKLKISGLNLKLPATIISEFKDPRSYLPLIASIFHEVPAHIATLLSLGMITTNIAYEYIRSNREIKNSGLYYLIDLNNRFGV